MDGAHLLTINPATLDDESLWSYQDLQKLAKALDIKAAGRRCELVARLLEWHKTRNDSGHSLVQQEDAEDYPLNVDGSNFSILSMHVRPRSPAAPALVAPSSYRSPVRSPVPGGAGADVGSIKKTNSLVGLSDSPLVVSPTLLRPLAPTTPVRTPGKSALKTPGSAGKSGKASAAKISRLKFSPYNGTKVIPNRRDESKGIHAQMAEHEREFRRSSRDDDEESLDDENDYVDEQARINAEKNVFVCANEDGCSSWQNEF